MRKKCFLCALLLLVSSGVTAQVKVRLLAEAEVAGPQILFGELGEIEGEPELAQALALTPVGAAPRPGERRTLSRNADLSPKLRRVGFRPQDFLWEGPDTVVVYGRVDPKQTQVIKEQLEAQLLAYLHHHPQGAAYSWQVEVLSGSIPPWPGDDVRVEFRKGELPVGSVTLEAKAGNPAKTFSYAAVICAYGEVLMTKTELAAETILTEEMVARKQLEVTPYLLKGTPPLTALSEQLEIRGSLPQGTVILEGDVKLPLLVKRGEPVTIYLETGAIQIEAAGKALADGSLGDLVPVLNVLSERTVEGIVTAPGVVRVGR